jgi:sugar phosphate isomerase/epimerase
MQLSQTTIFKQSIGSPREHLRMIAEAGFTHVHWSHQWYTDFLYSQAEIAQIKFWLSEFGLQVLDVHASRGIEKRWDSPLPYQRLAGVSLVKNRLAFADQVGAKAIVLHAEPDMTVEMQLKSLRELEPYTQLFDVSISIENFADEASHTRLEQLFKEFSPDVLSFCYDTGHGNMNESGLDFLDKWKDRLSVLHIHDNDGSADQHKLPFSGSVDWDRFAEILSNSTYTGPINLECMMANHDGMEEAAFLHAAFEAGQKLHDMRMAQAER